MRDRYLSITFLVVRVCLYLCFLFIKAFQSLTNGLTEATHRANVIAKRRDEWDDVSRRYWPPTLLAIPR